MSTPTRVLVWGENRHEQVEEQVRAIYPDGMHTTIAAGITEHLGDGAHCPRPPWTSPSTD